MPGPCSSGVSPARRSSKARLFHTANPFPPAGRALPINQFPSSGNAFRLYNTQRRILTAYDIDMDKFVIRGGNPLLGTVRVSGAKNAALPAMAAALLTDETVILENVPQVRDIETTRRLLSAMGAEVELGYG